MEPGKTAPPTAPAYVITPVSAAAEIPATKRPGVGVVVAVAHLVQAGRTGVAACVAVRLGHGLRGCGAREAGGAIGVGVGALAGAFGEAEDVAGGVGEVTVGLPPQSSWSSACPPVRE